MSTCILCFISLLVPWSKQERCSPADACYLPAYRYTSRGEFLEVHRKSAAFLLFKQLQSQLPFGVEVSGTSYIESGLGFMSR